MSCLQELITKLKLNHEMTGNMSVTHNILNTLIRVVNKRYISLNKSYLALRTHTHTHINI